MDQKEEVLEFASGWDTSFGDEDVGKCHLAITKSYSRFLGFPFLKAKKRDMDL